MPTIPLSTVQQGFTSSLQATREKLNTAHDVTELPVEYTQLEARAEAIREAHVQFLRVLKHYETDSYDYSNPAEAVAEFSANTYHSLHSSISNLRGTQSGTSTVTNPKTLPQALARAADHAAIALRNESQLEPLQVAFTEYCQAQTLIAQARATHDTDIRSQVLGPWSERLETQIGAVQKYRANVKSARLYLDGTKNNYKSSTNPTKQQSLKTAVEQAEDKLVQATEIAADAMRNLLDTVGAGPVAELEQLKAIQLAYHQAAVKALS